MSLPEPRPVRAYEAADERAFREEVQPLGEPALLRGLVGDWPIVAVGRAGPEALTAYLRPHATGAPVQAFEALPEARRFFTYTDDLTGFTFERRETTLQGLLDDLLASAEDLDAPALYAGGVNVPRVVPSLEAELAMPLLPPGTERLTSVWLGNGSRVPAHWDLPQNLAACVAGTRRFTLFPPSQVGNLYIGPLERTIAGQPSSLVDLAAPDLARFPRYAEAAEHALAAELEPGDVLYVPSLWLHAVEAPPGLGMLANFWWRDGPEHLVTPMLTLMHAQLTLRGMPAREREAWRHLFDHFVFGEEAGRHLPERARGVLGEPTPERLAWLRRVLARSLTR